MSVHKKQDLPRLLYEEALVMIDIKGGMAYFKCNHLV
jgi:hypothetical protein